jgi:exoribonuclease-2
MHVLYEESGSFKAGTVLAETEASLQVEAPHGKRSKVKAGAVLLRFEHPAPGELLREAEAYASGIDTDFLWECCGEPDFGFQALAGEYCGHAPNAVEAAAILLKLHSAPMYFHRKGRGRYRAAPPETLKAALASQEKKRRQQQQIDEWAQQLRDAILPEAIRAILPELLYKPDRNKHETKALEKACEESSLSPARLIERAGGLPSSHDYHLNRFLFECFPKGTSFPSGSDAAPAEGLPLAPVRAFSLDDAMTTEIDDAFSLTPLEAGKLRIGIHIAVPGLGFAPGSLIDAVARERLSTVYMPGRKITMLPPEVVERYTLAGGRACPALSLYLDIREHDWAIEREHTALEQVPIAANLRHQQLDTLDQAFLAGSIPQLAFAAELHGLWRFALAREAARGKPSAAQDRPDYNFHVDEDPEHGERIRITERRRGTPLDKLVAELMIHANSSWGRLLDQNGLAAIYRVQSNGKVRMTTAAAPHQGLGISHYAWATSPLRRYVDLVNQWQLLALLRSESAPFAHNEQLLSVVHDFETTYATYADFQGRMERYWSLRWLLQEGVSVVTAEVLRDNLVRIDGLPLYTRVHSLPALAPGTRVELGVDAIDLLDVEIRCGFRLARSQQTVSE